MHNVLCHRFSMPANKQMGLEGGKWHDHPYWHSEEHDRGHHFWEGDRGQPLPPKYSGGCTSRQPGFYEPGHGVVSTDKQPCGSGSDPSSDRKGPTWNPVGKGDADNVWQKGPKFLSTPGAWDFPALPGERRVKVQGRYPPFPTAPRPVGATPQSQLWAQESFMARQREAYREDIPEEERRTDCTIPWEPTRPWTTNFHNLRETDLHVELSKSAAVPRSAPQSAVTRIPHHPRSTLSATSGQKTTSTPSKKKPTR